jgi:hypothetical protein
MGLLLVLVPWSTFWDRNYFAELLPVLKGVITNNYVRGAVMGLGLINVWAALSELADIFHGRTRDDPGL